MKLICSARMLIASVEERITHFFTGYKSLSYKSTSFRFDAVVRDVKGGQVKVHYLGWSAMYDTWVPASQLKEKVSDIKLKHDCC